MSPPAGIVAPMAGSTGAPSGGGAPGRVIAHVDMDAYFVEVELLERPELRGRKLIVAQESGRSVVLSASYEARADGVRSAMPLARARRLSPEALVLPPHQGRYREISASIMAFFGEVTDAVEQLSVDEAFLDITGARRRLGDPEEIGRHLRAETRARFGLPCSVGIADRKFIAKIASTRAKPDGLLLVPPRRRLAFLHSLPVRALWGVGAKTAEALERLGITTVEQLAETPAEMLRARFGAIGDQLHALARGEDDRGVQTSREEKSLGAEETFAEDVDSRQELLAELLRLSHRVASRLRAGGHAAGRVGLKLRYRDFETLTRSVTLRHSTQSALVLHRQAAGLLDGLGVLAQPVRLIGLRAEALSGDDAGLQLSFDRTETNWIDAEEALDAVAARYPGGVAPASLLRRPTSRRGEAPDGAGAEPGTEPGTEPGAGPGTAPGEERGHG